MKKTVARGLKPEGVWCKPVTICGKPMAICFQSEEICRNSLAMRGISSSLFS
jgi:hypothetical protein